jgi:cysteine dioxygenase
MTTRSIDDFVAGLRGIGEARFSRQTVLAEFGRVVLDPSSLERYMFFCATHYTRNLIYRDDLFEVLALCWEKGQGSAIHNHRDQECWMGVPVGKLAVQNYRVLAFDEEAMTSRLAPSSTYVIDPTHPAAVDPTEPVHAVLNSAEFDRRAVSVHVYSRPFDSCLVYQLESGRCWNAPLDYTSRHGELCAGERAVPVRV